MRGGGEERRGGAAADNRGLLALVIGLGVLILLGFGVVIATLLGRVLHGDASAVATRASATVLLHEPTGTRIGGMVAIGDEAALLLQGGGAPDRVVFIDGRAGGAVTARVALAPAVPAAVSAPTGSR